MFLLASLDPPLGSHAAVLEAVGVIASLHDVAVVGQPVQQLHLGVTEHESASVGGVTCVPSTVSAQCRRKGSSEANSMAAQWRHNGGTMTALLRPHGGTCVLLSWELHRTGWHWGRPRGCVALLRQIVMGAGDLRNPDRRCPLSTSPNGTSFRCLHQRRARTRLVGSLLLLRRQLGSW